MQKTLLWAVNAFELEPQITACALDILRPLALRLGASVQPVHVLMPSQSGATEYSEITEVPLAQPLRPTVEHLLKNLTKKAKLPHLLEPLIIVVENTSIQAAVEELSRYADSIHAEAIVVSSHGRRGMGRFLLGSFAETLMSHPHGTIVVVHPGTQVKGLATLLFPSDLGEGTHRHFREVLALARELGSKIHILHCASNLVDPILQSGVYLLSGGWMPTSTPLNGRIEAAQRTIDRWVEEASKSGVQATGSIYSFGGGIADTILRVAEKEKTSFIAMATESGPIAATFLGSTARETVRRSRCPVVILKNPNLRHRKRGEKNVAA